MNPAVLEPASLEAPKSGYETEFKPEGLGIRSRYERIPGHLANLFDALADSDDETRFLNQTARRALKGEKLEAQDEADTARKTKTLAEFIKESSNQDQIDFDNSVADLKDQIRQRPGAPRVVAPVQPGIAQVLAAVVGGALDPKNAAAIGAMPGQEGMRQQQVLQDQENQNYKIGLQDQQAGVDAAKVEVEAAKDRLGDSRQLGVAQYNEQQKADATVRAEKATKLKERQDFAEKLIGKRVKTAADVAQLREAAAIAGYDLSPEYLAQAEQDITDEANNVVVRKEAEKLMATLRNSTDQQTRTAARQRLVSLAQTNPDAFPDPEGIIAAYSGGAVATSGERLQEARITGQGVLDSLRRAQTKVSAAVAAKIAKLTPLEAESYAKRIDLMVAQYGLTQERAAQVAIENEYLPEKELADIAKAQEAVAASKRGDAPGGASRADVKAGYDVVNGQIKELRDELKEANDRMSDVFADDAAKAEAKKQKVAIEKELAAKKKERDTYGELLKGISKGSGAIPPLDVTPAGGWGNHNFDKPPANFKQPTGEFAKPPASTKKPRREKVSKSGQSAIKLVPGQTIETTYKGQKYKVKTK